MDEPLGMPPSQEKDKAPEQKVEDPFLKQKPHNLDKFSNLDPELKDMFEKAFADKQNMERNFKVRDEELRKTQQKLTQLQQEKEAAEKAKLEEQGKYKELAEKAEREAQELRDRLFKVEVHSNLERELVNSGALDAEMASTFLVSKYGDDLRANPANAVQLVQALKESKPLLFKQEQAQQEPQQNPSKPTGQGAEAPKAGQQPSNFDARDKNVKPDEVMRRYREAMRNVSF